VSIEAAAEAVRAGFVVGMPTDTVYGIGVDPLNEKAVARLYEMKGRPKGKPFGLLVATADQAKEMGVIEGPAREIAALHWPGPLTLIVEPSVVLPDWVGDYSRTTVGIRVPDNHVARKLLAEVGPMAVTSANRSGGAEVMNDVDAREIFGDEVAVYLEGTAPGGAASTVVDATGAHLALLREGPVEIPPRYPSADDFDGPPGAG
jgi:tRNA threonylcarbamoyl adenosine modification protein (Sua5/YciO/YrdC/YwlC family)